MSKSSNNSKVICIGWHKTGTSTLGVALLKLGYNVVGARLDMAYPLLKGDKKTPIELAGEFDALQDVPWAMLFKELDKAYPGSKFILTERDENSWLNSAQKHFKNIHSDMHEWIYGKGVLAGNEDLYVERYRKHYREVRDYFKGRENDLLLMNFANGDGWEKLCPFLNQPIPNKAFPHENKGKHSYTKQDKIKNLIRSLIPQPLRTARVILMEKLGLHHGRNRFNNTIQNRKERQNKV